MRDQARHAPAPPGPQHPDPTNTAWTGPPPRRQHTRAIRARHAAGRQPGLDQNLIHLYRDQRVPPCIRARPSRSYVYPDIPREGRCPFPLLVTLTVPTTGHKSRRPHEPSSANPMTFPVPWSSSAATFNTRIGRPSTPIEVYLRLMFLKFRYRLGYETLCRDVADSF